MAKTAGISRVRRDRLTRTLQLLRAALRVWEVRHEDLQSPRVWRKPAQAGDLPAAVKYPRHRMISGD
jgi:hypothetical protein